MISSTPLFLILFLPLSSPSFLLPSFLYHLPLPRIFPPKARTTFIPFSPSLISPPSFFPFIPLLSSTVVAWGQSVPMLLFSLPRRTILFLRWFSRPLTLLCLLCFRSNDVLERLVWVQHRLRPGKTDPKSKARSSGLRRRTTLPHERHHRNPRTPLLSTLHSILLVSECVCLFVVH